jgi:type 1 glutamine amidotransferase
VEDLNTTMNGGTSSGGTGTTTPTAGSGVVGGTGVTGGTGTTAGTGSMPTAGSAGTGSVSMGGSGGSDATGGTGPMGGTGGSADVGPYAARSGAFKMLALTRTKGFRHDGSIGTGRTMLTAIAQEQGFEVTFADSGEEVDAAITAENLAKYEIIFHLNTTGDVYTDTQQQTFEDWMTQHNGAFAGVHSATDTENGWGFYSDVTGQYYNGHGAAGTPDQIKLEANMLEHAALKGVPNPWQRNEEWYKFDQWQAWTTKPGFQILGKKNADSQPIMWVREFGNFRSFYTALGHDAVAFQDATVKKHVTGGIMWAVRREHLIK